MADPHQFAKLVPGFDFLQGLMGKAGSALPDMGQWIAPSLDPAELEKRIEQLKTVQFWLEQNSRMISASIQALEVQRMTLSTLRSMNVPMADLSQAFKASTPAPQPAPEAADTSARPPESGREKRASTTQPEAAGTGSVDPMQWWSALTQQFGELAAKAVGDMAEQAQAKTARTEPSAPAKTPAKTPTKTGRKAPRKAAAKRKPTR